MVRRFGRGRFVRWATGTSFSGSLFGEPFAGSPLPSLRLGRAVYPLPPMCRDRGTPDWGYGADNGPEVWGRLDPAYAACSLGGEQSPIDLSGARPAALDPVEFDYRRARATIENTGHGIQVNPVPGSGIALDGVRYELQQFHFHHRSEHTVEGEGLAVEMHLVHADASGSLAVVGVLYEEGDANDALAPVWARFPPEPSPPRPMPEELDLAALLPDRRTMWRYRGSLTTPPCTEGVAWVILGETMTLSAGQIEAFAAIYPNNRRPVQPLGQRVLHWAEPAPCGRCADS